MKKNEFHLPDSSSNQFTSDGRVGVGKPGNGRCSLKAMNFSLYPDIILTRWSIASQAILAVPNFHLFNICF